VKNAWPVLELLRTRLAAVPGITTCKIGLEQGIVPEDYPIIRLVPSEIRAADGNPNRRRATVLVYFGAALDESTDGLEAVYQGLLEMETAIIEAAEQPGRGWVCRYVQTITDEDRLEHFKLMAVLLEING